MYWTTNFVTIEILLVIKNDLKKTPIKIDENIKNI